MKIRAKQIALSHAKPGMKLAEPIIGDDRRILLKIGIQLSEQSIALLRTHNIHSIAIQEDDDFRGSDWVNWTDLLRFQYLFKIK